MSNTRHGDAETRRDGEKIARSPRHAFAASAMVCSACGAEARRGNARFCLVCGKLLIEDYQPLDALRASYRLQGKSVSLDEAKQQQQQQQQQQEKAEEMQNLFERNENSVSQTAWACVVYSFVPYLGILFVPAAFLVGSFGVLVSYRKPYLGGRKLSLVSVALSVVVLVVQIFLWWLLYIIPEIGKQF
ncbi:MAG: hypothetical protein M3384_05075 [Acidobacteriota bacterium]|nr:hypothetical protein [Acidobacteriota bacterium]